MAADLTPLPRAGGAGGGSASDGNKADTPTPNPSRKQEGDFSSNAARLAGLAGALLGWRPDEFWAATPAELGAVIAALVPETEQSADRSALTTLMEQFPDG